jgi:hypothetical protein
MQRKETIDDFELEMWQYLDQTLSEQRIQYWNKQINSDIKLQQMLEESKRVLQEYKEIESPSISEDRYLEMIDIATSGNSVVERIKEFLKAENMIPLKAALVSILIIASLTFQLISSNAGTVKEITHSTFGWNDKSIENSFANISTNISFLENEALRNYYLYTKINDEWEQEVISINQKINKLFNESENHEL